MGMSGDALPGWLFQCWLNNNISFTFADVLRILMKSLPSGRIVRDSVGGESIAITFDRERKYPTVTDREGEDIPYVIAFWFAWQAFYPVTELWEP